MALRGVGADHAPHGAIVHRQGVGRILSRHAPGPGEGGTTGTEGRGAPERDWRDRGAGQRSPATRRRRSESSWRMSVARRSPSARLSLAPASTARSRRPQTVLVELYPGLQFGDPLPEVDGLRCTPRHQDADGQGGPDQDAHDPHEQHLPDLPHRVGRRRAFSGRGARQEPHRVRQPAQHEIDRPDDHGQRHGHRHNARDDASLGPAPRPPPRPATRRDRGAQGERSIMTPRASGRRRGGPGCIPPKGAYGSAGGRAS